MEYRFVDCRFELGRPERGRELYLEGHIPGAAFLDLERDGGGRADGDACGQRQLAEGVARPEDGEHGGIADGSGDPNGEPPAADQVQRVGRIPAVEDDLVAPEGPSSRDRQHPLLCLLGDAGKKPPPHGRESSALQVLRSV